jgi:quinol-cytochrome oxidoreductase complex cytochrome b subunit
VSSPGARLLDLGVLLSLVVLALQYFLNFFGLPWLHDHTSPDGYRRTVTVIRVGLVIALAAAAILGLLGYIRDDA